MDWQLVVVGLAVAAALGYLVRQSWRTWAARKGGCGGGCGCAKAPAEEANGTVTIIPSEQLTRRLRPPT
jgi:hypothetical protein